LFLVRSPVRMIAVGLSHVQPALSIVVGKPIVTLLTYWVSILYTFSVLLLGTRYTKTFRVDSAGAGADTGDGVSSCWVIDMLIASSFIA